MSNRKLNMHIIISTHFKVIFDNDDIENDSYIKLQIKILTELLR